MITFIGKFKPFINHFICLIAGGILPFAFAPFHQDWIAFISPILLLFATERNTPKQGFGKGFLFGLGFFGFGVYWVFHSIYYFGQTTLFLAYAITLLLVAVLALFPAFLMITTQRLFQNKPISRASLGFPALWVLFEMLRGSLFTGFPWLFLGTSQLHNPPFRAFAPVGSVWLVSWMILLTAGLTYGLFLHFYLNQKGKLKPLLLIAALGSIWIVGGLLHQISWVKPTPSPLKVALLQGNIPQQMRWESEAISHIMATYESLTEEAKDADLIIWPEGAIPVPLPYSSSYFARIENLLQNQGNALLAGVPVKNPNEDNYFNALMGLGKAEGVYYKSLLVPFGEFIPFEKVLRGLIGFLDLPMSSFVSEDNTKHPSLTAFDLKIAPAICYEITFPNHVRNSVLDKDVIVTVSNDAWFGTTAGPQQHLQMAQWRAIETGRYVLRATNTGISAIITPMGDLTQAPQFEKTILRGEITPMVGQTLWVKWGIGPLLVLLLVSFCGPLVSDFFQTLKHRIRKRS